MFLQGYRVSLSDHPHRRLTYFRSAKPSSKTNAEREEEAFQQFMKKHREKSNRRSTTPPVVHPNYHANCNSRIRPMSATVRSSNNSHSLRSKRPHSAETRRPRSTERAITSLEQTMEMSARDLSLYNTNYHHRKVVLKQQEVGKYEQALNKITINDASGAPVSGLSERKSVLISAKDVLASTDNTGNASYGDYITALRYQEVLLLEKKKRLLAEQQKTQRHNVASSIISSKVHDRWYELKDSQFTRELSKFNELTL